MGFVSVKNAIHLYNFHFNETLSCVTLRWSYFCFASSPKRSRWEMKRGEDGTAVKIVRPSKPKKRFWEPQESNQNHSPADRDFTTRRMRKYKCFGMRFDKSVFVTALICHSALFYILYYRKLDFAPQEKVFLPSFPSGFPDITIYVRYSRPLRVFSQHY